MDSATEIKTVAGEIGEKQQELRGTILQYALTLKNKGKSASTVQTYLGALYTLIGKGAIILNPSNVEQIIANQETWGIRAKKNYVDWYARFAKYLHIEWEKPIYKAPDKIPFIPTEAEIDQLIGGNPRRVSIVLQIAKETASRIGEVVRIKWTDIDFQRNIITINEPEKGSNTGSFNVSNQIIVRILKLPKTSERIFGEGVAIKDSITNMLITARRQLAFSFCNPHLSNIHFHTLRHWAITDYAHKVKDPFLVQIFARHKEMKCTARYIHYEKIIYHTSNNDEWTIRSAKTVDEAIELGKVGLEPFMLIQGVQLLRKRK